MPGTARPEFSFPGRLSPHVVPRQSSRAPYTSVPLGLEIICLKDMQHRDVTEKARCCFL